MADFAIFSTESEEYGKPAEYLAEIIIHNNNGGTILMFVLYTTKQVKKSTSKLTWQIRWTQFYNKILYNSVIWDRLQGRNGNFTWTC